MKKDKLKELLKNKWIIGIVIILLFIIIIITIGLFANKMYMQKYAPGKNWNKYDGYNLANVSDKLPLYHDYPVSIINKEKPNMFILYKLGCPFCDKSHKATVTAYNDMVKKYGKYNTIHYVEVNSTLGKYLVNKFNIEHSYNILLVSKSNMFYLYPEVKIDKNGNPELKVNYESIKQAENKFIRLNKAS